MSTSRKRSGVAWNTTTPTLATFQQNGTGDDVPKGQSSPFLSFINSAIAYANLTVMFGNQTAASYLQSQILEMIDDSANNLCPSNDSSVINGYKLIYQTVAENILSSGVGHVELLLWANGNSADEQQTLSIQISLQHPFSRGRVYINSNDTFDDPVIDPQYLSHWADLVSMRESIKLVRRIGQYPPLNPVLSGEVSPGIDVITDADIEAYLLGDVESQYHPASTMVMLPRDHGGVVDAKLRVYGLGNVRVVDSSVFPAPFAAHVRLFLQCAFFGFLTCSCSYKH